MADTVRGPGCDIPENAEGVSLMDAWVWYFCMECGTTTREHYDAVDEEVVAPVVKRCQCGGLVHVAHARTKQVYV